MSTSVTIDLRRTRNRFERRLRRFSRTRRRIVNRALAYRMGTVLLTALAAVMIVPSLRFDLALLDAVLMGVLLLLPLVMGVAYLWKRQRYPGNISEAFRMEQVAGNLNSRLISAYDFLERELDAPLPNAVIAAAMRDMDAPVFEPGLNRHAAQRARRRFLLLVLLIVTLGFTEWFGYHRLAARGAVAWIAANQLIFPTEWELDPGPGRHVRLLGDEIELALRFTRNPFDTVTLVRRFADPNQPEERETLRIDSTHAARKVLSTHTESQWQLHFEFGRYTTAETPFEVVFTTRPILENMQLELIAPAYTRQPPRDLEGLQSRIAALPGTRVGIALTFSKPLDSATLSFDHDDLDIPMDEHGRFAGTSFVVSEARRARIQIEDVHGFGLAHPHVLDIDLLVDEPPRLAVPAFLKAEMPARAEALPTFGFGVRAWDDYGVSRTVLKWRQATLDNRHAITAQGEIERPVEPPLPSVIADFQNVFEDLSVRPGDLISFHIEVEDNRDPAPQITSSATFSFFIHADDLDGMGLGRDLMFGHLAEAAGGARGRIARARRETSVPAPQDIRTLSQLRSDFEADVQTHTRPPTISGSFANQVEDYFRVLSTAVQTANETAAD